MGGLVHRRGIALLMRRIVVGTLEALFDLERH